MNDDKLRAELARIASGVPSSAALPEAALTSGRRLARRRRSRVRAVATVSLVVSALGWYGVAGPSTTPASAAVACYRDRVVVARHRVAVGREGVRLDVTNATPEVVRLVAGDAAALVPPGRSSVEVALPPGPVAVACDTGAPVAPMASLTVTDAHHLYVRDALDCARPSVRTYRGADGVVSGDPVALTTARLAGTLPHRAVAEPAGYPAAYPRRLVRVRLDSYVVALAIWHAMPSPGTWTLDELRLCAQP